MAFKISDANRSVIIGALKLLQKERSNSDLFHFLMDYVDPGKVHASFIEQMITAIDQDRKGNTGPQSYSVAVLSYQHIQADDLLVFDRVYAHNDLRGSVVHKTVTGYLLSLNPEFYYGDLMEMGASNALLDAADYAVARGYQAIEFNQGIELVKDLPRINTGSMV